MKSFIRSTGTLLTGLILTSVSAQIITNNPTGLNTLINTNNVTFMQEVGNINVAGFNALGERLAFTFEEDDGYSGTTRYDRIELLESAGSPMNLRINFGSDAGFRFRNDDFATGGDTALVYQGNANTVTFDFIDPLNPSNAQPVTGVAFTANRIISGNMTVSLFSDLARTQQIGSTFTINDNNASGGSNHSFFGYFDGNASIASVVIDSSLIGTFWIDDLNITTIPEPSSLILMFMGLGCLVGMQRLRKRHA
jgi:hypothetical protein